MKRAYPGALPTFLLAAAQASITTSFTALGVDIADVLKFAGAGGGLVCSFGLPALIHGKVHWKAGTLTPTRALVVLGICAFGLFCFAMQLVPAGAAAAGNATNATTP